ncbi:hypothetical protein [Oceanobacillus sp. FSL H7-0719]|uniref:hypothetical protein n=1 Tax=Oceanobacillus sp. FSL H7-0719 TaxID=2954507 RepID=UPI00324A89F4
MEKRVFVICGTIIILSMSIIAAAFIISNAIKQYSINLDYTYEITELNDNFERFLEMEYDLD